MILLVVFFCFLVLRILLQFSFTGKVNELQSLANLGLDQAQKSFEGQKADIIKELGVGQTKPVVKVPDSFKTTIKDIFRED